ncbi:MAG: hypothetical protein WAK17_26340 [Candidatus Nitrosopolaris sp.]
MLRREIREGRGMTKCKHEYDDAKQKAEHVAHRYLRRKKCHMLVYQGTYEDE